MRLKIIKIGLIAPVAILLVACGSKTYSGFEAYEMGRRIELEKKAQKSVTLSPGENAMRGNMRCQWMIWSTPAEAVWEANGIRGVPDQTISIELVCTTETGQVKIVESR